MKNPNFFNPVSRGRSREFMEDSISQISGNSCSIPSEPPDIGNWFSSYKFESFVLDTYEDFGNFVSRDNENSTIEVVNKEDDRKEEDNIGESREQDPSFSEIPNSLDPASLVSEPPDIRNWCQSYVYESREQDQSLSEIPNSVDPALLVSEPPDIRNWCQSYVYESPALCTHDDFASSSHNGSECEKDAIDDSGLCKETKEGDERRVSDVKCSSGLVKCNSSFGVSKLDDPSLCKIDDSNDSLSFLSEEPPDIKNWFSSYTYQSPILDESIADEFRDSPFEEKDSEDVSFAVDVEDSDKEEENCSGVTRKAQVKDEITPGAKLSSSQFEKEHQDHESTRKGNDKGIVPKMEQNSSNEVGFVPLSTKNCSEQTDIASNEHILEFKAIRRGALFRKPAQRSEKENEEPITENGFITTRKTRKNQENPPKTTQQIVQECLRKYEDVRAGKRDAIEKRSVLGETINIQHNEGLTGKWRCPQKTKPQRGPPLKQLRLEQWVRRV